MMTPPMDFFAAFAAAGFYVEQYHALGYLAVFFGSFLETIPFSGLLVPGNIMMVLAGMFAYEGYLRTEWILALAIGGGILGDTFGYWLGKRYNHHYEKKSLAAKRASFEKTELYFKQHGGKSVFLARFIGPLRPFIAFIAGASKMAFSSFFFYSMFSAVVWAVGFFLIGYLFEGSMESVLLWIKKVDRILLGIAVAFLVAFVSHRYLLPWLRVKKEGSRQEQ